MPKERSTETGWQNRFATSMIVQNTRRLLWAFAGQSILIICLIVWSDSFSAWLYRIILATSLLLPPIVYLSILAQPPVRQAWRFLLGELFRAAILIPPAILGLFSFKNFTKLARLILNMKMFPSTMDDWIAFALFPFKVYLLAAFPTVFVTLKIIAHFQHLPRQYDSETVATISLGYLLSLAILLFGALVQALVSRSGRSTQTIYFFFAGIFFIFFWAKFF